MKKLLFILLLFPVLVKAQTSGTPPGSTTLPQNQAWRKGSTDTAKLYLYVGPLGYFSVPTLGANNIFTGGLNTFSNNITVGNGSGTKGISINGGSGSNGYGSQIGFFNGNSAIGGVGGASAIGGPTVPYDNRLAISGTYGLVVASNANVDFIVPGGSFFNFSNKARYTSHPAFAIGDSLTHVDKKYVDAAIAAAPGGVTSVTGANKINVSPTTGAVVVFADTSGTGLATKAYVGNYQPKITLTTTGTSGSATLVGNTLNIPQYSGGGGVVSSVSGTNNQVTVSPTTGATVVGLSTNAITGSFSSNGTGGNGYIGYIGQSSTPTANSFGTDGMKVFSDASARWAVVRRSGNNTFTNTQDDFSQQLGDLINDNFDRATTGFTLTGSNISQTITGGQWQISNATGNTSYSNYASLGYTTWLPEWDYSVVVSPTTSGNGLAIGYQSASGIGYAARLDMSSAGNRGTLYIENISGGTGTTIASSSVNAFTYSNGDVFTLRLKRIGYQILAQVYKSGQAPITVVYNMILNDSPIGRDNQLKVYSFGGTQLISNLKFTSTARKFTEIATIGDSNMYGYNSGLGQQYNFTAQSTIGTYTAGNSVLYAASGGKLTDFEANIAEFIKLRPHYALIHLGTNDAIASLSSASYQTSMNNVLNALTSNGIQPIICTVIPTSNSTYNSFITQYNTYINGLSSKYIVIDTYTALVSGGVLNTLYDSGDGLHMNAAGHYTFAATVMGALPTILRYNNGNSVIKAASASTRETIQSYGVSDAPLDRLKFGNATSTNGVFVPSINGQVNSDANRSAIQVAGLVYTGNDSGTAPAISLNAISTTSQTDGFNGTLGSLTVKPVLGVYNGTSTSVFHIMPDSKIGFGGITAPSFALHGQNTSASMVLDDYNTTIATAGGVFVGRKSHNATLGTLTNVVAGEELAAFGGQGYAASQWSGLVGKIGFYAEQDYTSNTAIGSYAVIGVVPHNTSSRADVIRINENGGTYFGGNTTASAWVKTAPGTTSMAAMQFTSGADLTSPTAGSWYFNGARLAFSPSTTIKRVPLFTDATPAVGQFLQGNGTDFSLSNLSSLVDNTLSKTADYTIQTTDFSPSKKTVLDLYVDATAGNVTITLPSASTFQGYTIYVTKTDASVNTVTVASLLGGGTISTQYASKQANSNGTSWFNH